MSLQTVRSTRARGGFRSVRYRNAAGKWYDALVVGRGTNSNEQQTLNATGATGGSVTLSWTNPRSEAAGPSASINFNATATDVLNALVGLSNIDPGDVLVTGGPLNTTPIVVEFSGQYGGQNVALITKTGTLATTDLTITETRAPVLGGLRLKLTSFVLQKVYVDDVPKATALTSTNAYHMSWGPNLGEA